MSTLTIHSNGYCSETPCRECGTQLRPMIFGDDICSRECWIALAEKGQVVAKYPCCICGVEADGSGWGNEFCSRKCRNAWLEECYPTEEEETHVYYPADPVIASCIDHRLEKLSEARDNLGSRFGKILSYKDDIPSELKVDPTEDIFDASYMIDQLALKIKNAVNDVTIVLEQLACSKSTVEAFKTVKTLIKDINEIDRVLLKKIGPKTEDFDKLSHDIILVRIYAEQCLHALEMYLISLKHLIYLYSPKRDEEMKVLFDAELISEEELNGLFGIV